MRKRGLRTYVQLTLLAGVVFAGYGVSSAFAVADSTSDNYQITEAQFTTGADYESCSAQYCAQASIGDTSSPRSTSSAFGAVSDSIPDLSVIVNSGESNLGVLTTERTATKEMTVSVRNYLSGGYVLQIIGDAPIFEGHSLATPETPVSSVPGTEQFAINAAKNTNPIVGAEVLQVPADGMVFGVVEDEYKSPNLFKYISGDVVGRGLTNSGQADYTISMIVNISSATLAGRYSGDFSAVVIPVY